MGALKLAHYETKSPLKIAYRCEEKEGEKVLQGFLSVDPLTKEYPELTPYQFASNTPIWGNDRDGLELNTTTTYVNKPVPFIKQPKARDVRPASNSSFTPFVNFLYKLDRATEGNNKWALGVTFSSGAASGDPKGSSGSKAKEGAKLLEMDYQTFLLMLDITAALSKDPNPYTGSKSGANSDATNSRNSGAYKKPTQEAADRATKGFENADYANQTDEGRNPFVQDQNRPNRETQDANSANGGWFISRDSQTKDTTGIYIGDPDESKSADQAKDTWQTTAKDLPKP